MTALIANILSSAFDISLPWIGVSFGIFVVFLWSLPLLVRLIKSIF